MEADNARLDAFEDYTGPDKSDEMPDELALRLQDLQPNEGNPFERAPLEYNPLNHAYPMVADTSAGVIEIMVQFAVIRGRSNLPEDMAACADDLQVPVAIEDVPVFEIEKPKFFGEEFGGWESPQDAVNEAALAEEMTTDGSYYLIPMIVRARRFSGGEKDAADSWESLSRKDTASIISGPALLDLIKGYAEKVAQDPAAPAGLVDLLNHFSPTYNRHAEDGVDEEWDPENN